MEKDTMQAPKLLEFALVQDWVTAVAFGSIAIASNSSSGNRLPPLFAGGNQPRPATGVTE